MNTITNYKQQSFQPAFEAIKIVKCNNQEAKVLINEMMPVLKMRSHELFKGKSILHSDLANQIAIQAKKIGFSPEWLLQNAKQKKILIPQTDSAPLYDISGKDLISFHKYRFKMLIKMTIYNFMNMNKKEIKSLPPHLRWLKILSDFADKQQESFNKFIKKHNPVEMDIQDYINSTLVDVLKGCYR